MHESALQIGRLFFETYAKDGAVIVDLGAYDWNGTLRSVCPPNATYVGLDVSEGPGVDLVVEPGKPTPLPDGYADIVVTTSAFEHDGAFWLTFLELVRIAKPGGLIYLNAPSNGDVHNFPEDCWRFYPDAGLALERWAKRSGQPVTLVESFVAERSGDIWNDFIAIFIKAEEAATAPGQAFVCDLWPAVNIRKLGVAKPLNPRQHSQDRVLLEEARAEVGRLQDVVARLTAETAQEQA